MAVDDSSWRQKRSGMRIMDRVILRPKVKYANGSIDLVEVDGILYLQAEHSVNSQMVIWLNSLMDNDSLITSYESTI
jgi:hypothetical protein